MKILALFTSLIFILTTACSENVSFDTGITKASVEEGGPGSVDGTVTGSFSDKLVQEAQQQKVDILLVVDNSGSMSDEQELIADRMNSFLSHIKDSDWQMGIVTTDVNAPAGMPGFSGELDFFSGTTDRILRPGDSDIITKFKNTVKRSDDCGYYNSYSGECTSNSEEPLEAIMKTLSNRDTVNSGFFRPNAALVVVIISDEDEQSEGMLPDSKAAEVKAYVEALYPGKKMTTYGVIIEPGDSSCLWNNATGAYGTHVNRLVGLTDGLTFSICSANYGTDLVAVSKDMKKKLMFDQMTLTHNPIESTLTVEVIPADPSLEWSLQNGNKVVFNKKPSDGSEVKVSYQYNK